jgi:hypothetical protein
MGGTCGTHGILKRGYGVLVGQPEEKSSFRRLGPRRGIVLKRAFKKKNWRLQTILTRVKRGASFVFL